MRIGLGHGRTIGIGDIADFSTIIICLFHGRGVDIEVTIQGYLDSTIFYRCNNIAPFIICTISLVRTIAVDGNRMAKVLSYTLSSSGKAKAARGPLINDRRRNLHELVFRRRAAADISLAIPTLVIKTRDIGSGFIRHSFSRTIQFHDRIAVSVDFVFLKACISCFMFTDFGIIGSHAVQTCQVFIEFDGQCSIAVIVGAGNNANIGSSTIIS